MIELARSGWPCADPQHSAWQQWRWCRGRGGWRAHRRGCGRLRRGRVLPAPSTWTARSTTSVSNSTAFTTVERGLGQQVEHREPPVISGKPAPASMRAEPRSGGVDYIGAQAGGVTHSTSHWSGDRKCQLDIEPKGGLPGLGDDLDRGRVVLTRSRQIHRIRVRGAASSTR